jgi:hypothetical protein
MAVALAILLPLHAAEAKVTVTRKVLYKGLYSEPACEAAKDRDCFGSSLCEANVEYPVIAGMRDMRSQNTFNEYFLSMAKKHRCADEQTLIPEKDVKEIYSGAEFLFNGETMIFDVFQNNSLISIDFYEGSWRDSLNKMYGDEGYTKQSNFMLDTKKEELMPLEDVVNREKDEEFSNYIFRQMSKEDYKRNVYDPAKDTGVEEEHARGLFFFVRGEVAYEDCKIPCMLSFRASEVWLKLKGIGEYKIPSKFLINPQRFEKGKRESGRESGSEDSSEW